MQYEVMVMNYTRRGFGFEDDVVHAFRGFINSLRLSLSDSLFWGLLILIFDLAFALTFIYRYPIEGEQSPVLELGRQEIF